MFFLQLLRKMTHFIRFHIKQFNMKWRNKKGEKNLEVWWINFEHCKVEYFLSLPFNDLLSHSFHSLVQVLVTFLVVFDKVPCWWRSMLDCQPHFKSSIIISILFPSMLTFFSFSHSNHTSGLYHVQYGCILMRKW